MGIVDQSPASSFARTPRQNDPLPRRWLTVALLCLLYAISFVDRMIIALIVDPLKADLDLSDVQIGLLFGFGFALLYTICGIPIAHLIDRGNRKRILLGGIMLWTGATFVSAFAHNYAVLLCTRAGVAIGEAVLTPVAVSMIADLFPRERRALPTSIYSMVGAVMASGAFIVGAGAIIFAGWLGASTGIAAWRLTLVVVAVPGVLVASLFALLLSEPPRSAEGGAHPPMASLGEAASHAWNRRGVYFSFFCGVGFMLAIAISLVAWAPTYLIRDHGVTTAAAGSLFGLAAVSGSIVGTMSVTAVIRRLNKAAPEKAVIQAAILYALSSGPLLALGIGMQSLAGVLIVIAVAMIGLSASAVLSPLLIQYITPATMRARMVALYLLLSGMLSFGLGPLLVSVLADSGLTSGPGIAGALSVTSWSALSLALACFLIAARSMARRSDRGGALGEAEWASNAAA